MFLLYIHKNYISKRLIFFEDLLPCVSFQAQKVGGISVLPTSQLRAFTICYCW